MPNKPHQWRQRAEDAYGECTRTIHTCSSCGVGRQLTSDRRTVYFMTAEYAGARFNLTEQEPPCRGTR